MSTACSDGSFFPCRLTDDCRQDNTNSLCRLLNLPSELRLYVYELTVIRNLLIRVTRLCALGIDRANKYEHEYNIEWRKGGNNIRLQPALSRTCKSVRADVLQIFYGRNTFEASYCGHEGQDDLDGWLNAIGVENRCLLEKAFALHPYEGLDYDDAGVLSDLRAKVVSLGGNVENVSVEEGVRHQLVFAPAKDDEVKV